MALSKQVTPTSTLRAFLAWAAANGYRVGEHPDYGGVTPGVHTKGSWHDDGLAADINYGTNGAGERAKLLVALAEAERLGLALTYARDGVVGTAKNHRNHLHVDVGEWSNYGSGNVRRRAGTAGANAGASAGVSAGASATLKQVQARLNRDYPAYSRLVVDGINGPRTRAVVMEFQRRAGLVVDGIAGPATRKKLGLS